MTEPSEAASEKRLLAEIERLRVRLDPKVQLDRLETTDLAEQLLFNDMLSHTIDQLSAEVEHLEQQLAKATNQVEGGDAH